MSDLAPTVIVLPGASLMQIQRLTNEATLVTCPACGASHLFTSASEGATAIRGIAFIHEDQRCPILLRIQAALRMCAAPSLRSVQ